MIDLKIVVYSSFTSYTTIDNMILLQPISLFISNGSGKLTVKCLAVWAANIEIKKQTKLKGAMDEISAILVKKSLHFIEEI